MFVPLLDDEEEEELHQQQQQQQFHHGGQGRLPFGTLIARVVKINNILLLLSLGVATYVHVYTLEPQYLNALMWGIDEQTQAEETSSSSSQLSTQSLVLRSLQSLCSVLLLTFLRTVVFPSITRQPQDEHEASMFESVLSDLLFHIQCRLCIGFLACFTTPWIPFDLMETAVVCISVAMQIAKQEVLQ